MYHAPPPRTPAPSPHPPDTPPHHQNTIYTLIVMETTLHAARPVAA